MSTSTGSNFGNLTINDLIKMHDRTLESPSLKDADVSLWTIKELQDFQTKLWTEIHTRRFTVENIDTSTSVKTNKVKPVSSVTTIAETNKVEPVSIVRQTLPSNVQVTVDLDGTLRWYKNHNIPHRDNDEPAIIFANGTKVWYKEGKIHRDDDKPAIIYHDGSEKWYRHGQLHRESDEPAIIDADGDMQWLKNGQLHRNGMPAHIYKKTRNGVSYLNHIYYNNGTRARKIVFEKGVGVKEVWYENGKPVKKMVMLKDDTA